MVERTVSVKLRMLVNEYNTAAGKAAASTSKLAAAQKALAREAGVAGRAVDAAGQQLDDYADKAERAAAAARGLADVQGGVVRGTRSTGRAAEKTASQLNQYTVATTAAAAATRSLGAAQSNLPNLPRQRATGGGASGGGASQVTAGLQSAAIAAGALASAGGALKVLPPVLSATAAAGGALPGILGGAAIGAGTLKVAMLGVGGAIDEVFKTDDPFERLSPNARKLVAQMERLKPQLIAFQQGLQDRVLAGADANLARLGRTTLPAMSRATGLLADDWAQAFTAMTDAATDPKVLGAFNTVAGSADKFFDQIISRVQPAARSLATLVEAADPLVQAIGNRMVAAIDTFLAKVEMARQSGSLAEFFKAGAENADAMLSIAGDLLGIMGRVVSAVNQQNGSLTSAAASLDAYMASGRSASDIAGIVDTLTTAYEGMASVLGPLGGIARDALADPATRDAIEATFAILSAGSQALRVVFDLFSALPGPVQSTVLAAVALGMAASKVNTALGLMSLTAGRAATNLTAMGTAGAVAGRGLTGLAGVASKGLGLLFVLQLAKQVAGTFQDDLNPQIDALSKGLVTWGQSGKLAGEATRVLGADMEDLGVGFKFLADSDNDRRGFVRWGQDLLEDVVPGLEGSNTSLTKTRERVTAMDQALAGLVQGGQGEAAAVTFTRLSNALAVGGVTLDEVKAQFPQYAAAIEAAGGAAGSAVAPVTSVAERTKILAGSFRDASLAGYDLAGAMDVINGKALTSVEAQIAYERSVDESRKTIEGNRKTLNLNTEAGRENMAGLVDQARAAVAVADAKAKATGNEAAGIPILQKAREEFIRQAAAATGLSMKTGAAQAAAKRLADEIFMMPNKKVDIDADTGAATKKIVDFNFAVNSIRDGRSVRIDANTADANAAINAIKYKIAQLRDQHINVTGTVYWKSTGDMKVPGGTQLKNAQGGVYQPAAGGLVRPEIAPPGTRYQWAEPETGGELFLPKRGIDRERGRELLGVAASWYNGMFIPMAQGGVRAAATGLVNFAARETPTTTRATPLDYAESYLRSREAVAGLNQALKDNGRSFTTATKKGRENQSALIGGIRAAQDVARTKYEETGSVNAANKAYDTHIAALRRTLAQQKVNAATIRKVMSVASRPVYEGAGAAKAPANSLTNIAFAKSTISAEGALAGLRDTLSLSRPTLSVTGEEGRENLSAIIGFIEAAGAAAQDRFTQTRNSGQATGVYNQYVAQLRRALSGAGYSQAAINGLIGTYGRITLQPNAIGGVYGLGEAKVFPQAASTMYGFAEPGTGGELFLPRQGSRQRGEDILAIGAGWYGGKYVSAGGSGGSSSTVNNNLTVNALTYEPSTAELQAHQRRLDTMARVGRPS